MTQFFRFYRDSFRGLPREIWYLSVVLLINRSGTMVLTFLPLYLTRHLDFDLAFAGQLLSVYGLGHFSGAIIGGWLADRLGPIRTQQLALFTSGLAYLVFEPLRSASALLAITFVVATAAESFRPANGLALVTFAPKTLRTRAVALNRMALNLGFGVGPALGGWLASRDYAWLFRVDGATCLAAATVLTFLFRGRMATHPGRSQSSGSATPEIASDATHQGPAERHPLRDHAFLAFLGLTVLFTLLFFQGWTTYPVYLHDVYGFDEARFGLLLTLNAALILLFEMVLTHAAERFAPLRVAGFGVLLFGLGMALLPLGSGVALAVVSLMVWTLGEMLFAPFAGGWVANRAGERHGGKVMGLYTMAWGVGFVIAPTAGTWLYHTAGGTTLWLTAGAVGLLTAVGFEALQRWTATPTTATLEVPEEIGPSPAPEGVVAPAQ